MRSAAQNLNNLFCLSVVSVRILIFVDGRNGSGSVGRGRQVPVSQSVGGDLEHGDHEHQQHADDAQDGSRTPRELVFIRDVVLDISVATALSVIKKME